MTWEVITERLTSLIFYGLWLLASGQGGLLLFGNIRQDLYWSWTKWHRLQINSTWVKLKTWTTTWLVLEIFNLEFVFNVKMYRHDYDSCVREWYVYNSNRSSIFPFKFLKFYFLFDSLLGLGLYITICPLYCSFFYRLALRCWWDLAHLVWLDPN